jgi:hypothetical protein
LILAGGTIELQNFTGVFRFPVIEKVGLPAHWDKFVKKSKDIVPTY